MARLFNGITLHSTVETTPGADAATERIQPESYVLDLKLLAHVPSPNKTIEELAKVSPQLPTLLPGLTSMLSADSVSPLFAQLYDTKVRMLRENLGRLDLLLSRHNFFDCQAVLQLQHPETHRKALLLRQVAPEGVADRLAITATRLDRHGAPPLRVVRPTLVAVGVRGLEPPTSYSQSRRATRLRHTP